MQAQSSFRIPLILFLGDAAAILAAVLIGFQFHGETSLIGQRIGYTFSPWLMAWGLAAPALNLFKPDVFRDWKRTALGVIWAMSLAAPLATLLRAAWLDTNAVPIFALILGLATALAILIWRLLYLLLVSRREFADE